MVSVSGTLRDYVGRPHRCVDLLTVRLYNRHVNCVLRSLKKCYGQRKSVLYALPRTFAGFLQQSLPKKHPGNATRALVDMAQAHQAVDEANLNDLT